MDIDPLHQMDIDHLHQVGIGATDLDASIVFYRDVVGLRFLGRFDPPGLGFFQVGEVRLLIEEQSSSGVLYFWVPDIEVAAARLAERGVTFDQPPHLIHRDIEGRFGTAGEEEWMAFFTDPAGNTVALATRRPAGT